MFSGNLLPSVIETNGANKTFAWRIEYLFMFFDKQIKQSGAASE